MGKTDEATQLAEVIARVVATHPGRSTADIVQVVQTLYAGFGNAKIREFVPLLVEREARAVLATAGRGSPPALASGAALESTKPSAMQPTTTAGEMPWLRHLLTRSVRRKVV
jgi:hypothetical protein